MSDGIWWRKIKRNVIRDDVMRMIAEELDDDSLRPLVLNFYIIAYMLADDDGVFDFGNGKVFRRLMYAPSLEAVQAIRDALVENGVITPVFDNARNPIDTLYLISDWRDVNESPYKERPARTADARRADVASRIAEEKEAQYAARNATAAAQREIRAAQKNRTAGAPPVPVVHVDFDAMAPSPAASCDGCQQPPPLSAADENDKNAKNVVKDFFDDKKAKSVVHAQDKTIQDSTRQDRTGSVRSSAQSPQDKTAAVRSSARAAVQDNAGQDAIIPGEADCGSPRSGASCHAASAGAVAPPEAGVSQEETPYPNSLEKRIAWSKKCGVYEILSSFFAKKCSFPEDLREYNAFLLLSELCCTLADGRNNPQMVAGMLIGIARKLFPGVDLLPTQVAEPSVLVEIAEQVRRLLDIDPEQVSAALAAYNAGWADMLQSEQDSEGAPKKSLGAQSLAVQALSEDTG